MPSGKARKVANKQQEPLSEEVSLTSLNKSMLITVDQELRQVGSETRAKLVKDLPNVYDVIVALAQGITVKSVKDVDGEPRLVVYTVPPLWGAVKYLADWGRKIVGTDPAERKEVGLTKETMDFIRECIREQAPYRPALPEPKGGVVILGDYREVKQKNG